MPAAVEAALGLGSNLGHRQNALRAGVALLDRDPKISILAVSSVYETAPWGKTDQPPFLNAAIRILTDLTPRQLLIRALETEFAQGRIRSEKWGPRLIDIDIVVFGDAVVDVPGLRIPHPRLADRAFVLVPLAEIWTAPIPNAGKPKDLLAKLDQRGIKRLAGSNWFEMDGVGHVTK